MSTSGTINSTVIKTSKLLEKAIRRIGKLPAELTPEIVSNAQESLFMLLMSLSNRGLNLWCIDKRLIALEASKATYVLPTGTQSVLNMLHAVPVLADGQDSATQTTYRKTLTEATKVVRFGIEFGTGNPVISSFTFESSDDSLTWTTILTVDKEIPAQDTLAWYDLDPAPTALYFRINCSGNSTFNQFLLATEVREVMVAKFNRDDYANQPNKTVQSNQVTNYYFEKLVSPQITVWPVPNDSTRHLVVFRYRQIQDVGSLTQELELPARWLEAICWHLALRLAFEVPGVDPARRAEVAQMANGMVMEVEDGETDNAPSYYAPNIGVYNR